MKSLLQCVAKKLQPFLNDNMETRIRERILKQLSTLQAVDISFKHCGHIVILARINDRDICKILSVPKGWTLMEYTRFLHQIKETFGATLEYCDIPHFDSDHRQVHEMIYNINRSEQ